MSTIGIQETFRPAFPERAKPPYNRVSYGLSFQASCAKHVKETFKSRRAYVVASTSLSKQTSHVKDLEAALGDNHAGTWIGIRPHTPWEDLVPIINDMREKSADLLITLGGGSLTDGAKVITYALAQNPPIRTIDDLDSLVQQNSELIKQKDTKAYAILSSFAEPSDVPPDITIPIICIPTTLSAGEYTRFGGGTSSITHLKAICTHPKMLPALVILDPTLTLTTPEWVWLSTGVRAMDHCVESMCMLNCPDEVAKSSSKALGMLIPNLLKTKADPQNLDARLQCQIAANIVTVCLLYIPQRMLAGASHGIGHQLGPLGVGHGHTSCVLLPAVLKYNESVNGKEQQRAKAIIWEGGEDAGVQKTLKEAALDKETTSLGETLDVIFRELGMPRTLKEVGIEGKQEIEIIARNSIKDSCTMANPRPMDSEELVMQVLEMVRG